MKCALLISGYLRSFRENIASLQKYLLDGNNIDIYIHITKDPEQKYNNGNISLDEIYTLINPKIMIVSKNIWFHENTQQNNILNENYKYYLLNTERKKIEQAENITYDILIKMRPDVRLQEKITLIYDKEKLYIPKDSKMDISKLNHPTDHNICDIIAFGPVPLMDYYFDFYTKLNELIQIHGRVNETLLYHYLKDIPYELINIDYIVILSRCNTIAITGDSGSGKTSLSTIIKQLFNNSFVLECDRYHKWERGNNNWNTYTHLNPEANYLAKMTKDVFNLKLGNNIYQVDYNHQTGKFTDKELIESTENIIVCGLHTLYMTDNIINLKIFIDTDTNLKTPWKIKRDVQKRGYSIEKIIKQIKDRSEDYIKYILPQREQSDIIINFYTTTIFDINTFSMEDEYPVLLKVYIKKHLGIVNLIAAFNITQLIFDDNYYILDFKETYDYEHIIKTIIKGIHQML